ncbi:MAG: CDP-diacylglycerol--glycerol-3-phosphate 3-phosphatidyltransferase [Alphaproteobacteria bacterium]|jgi:cardiolipin synthase|nr:CDP-diacylglycerol--glycerol-3-phosphate 3-phosphatidyltransferase [Alphaproteobacteria bacterium]MDP7183186.1 CDP-diacylglycerol--glycerol-3-phosphate 3-phosphatidyltransferase [Alphaproteobacteria bacterium]MDP7190978.1 CDP-diacylglycerol--glycerol-3-phosphate 3-phosphatidyltransferase [Alphaproteobacteria bacterium]MDP7456927.1 CDP-diacylglycerol--glycerol-3-phosphate 3-phosphatidyltransferase [Alphaproteobacteria bacterium]HJO88101.1 CDP-diacylglycerol--glycerol-3-phosphate 3-phosphatidy|tara:strand:+ start:92 stop:703 length:612 start_codon:yes stop_codon:yes gene_type:complete
MITTLPNLLTLSRIAVIPILVWLFFLDGAVPRWIALGFFTLAGITDFFDGYLARVRGQYSALGKFLDPVADKILIAAVILMLVAFDRISGLTVLPAVIILIREILVSGLREFLANLHVGVPVSRLAKWKTTIQMFALGFLIVGDASPDWIPAVLIGDIGVWLAAGLTLITGYDYMQAGLRRMLAEEGEHRSEGKEKPEQGPRE